jgi:hypothetical protein
MTTLVIMGHEGHRTMTADPDVEESLQQVQEEFDRLIADGYAAFVTSVEPGEKIEKFDPEAGEITMFGPVAGG